MYATKYLLIEHVSCRVELSQANQVVRQPTWLKSFGACHTTHIRAGDEQ